MLSCAKISLLMFLRRIFSKALWGSGRAPLLRFDGISCGSLKIWSPRTDLWPELRKESDWLTSWLCSNIELLTPETFEIFSLPKAVLSLLSALYQSCCNKNSQTFLASSIVPDLFRWTLLWFKCLSMSMVSVWSIKMISRSPHMSISRLFTSCALLFKLSFRGAISDIVTAFVFDCRDSARSVIDLDIWLAVLFGLEKFYRWSLVFLTNFATGKLSLQNKTFKPGQITYRPVLISKLFQLTFVYQSVSHIKETGID